MQQEFEQVIGDHRERLTRMVRLRLDPRLAGRVDASDVIQEALIEANDRFEEYQRDQEVPIYTWLRFLTCQKLLQFHRRHLNVQARDVRRDVSMHQRKAEPMVSSAAIAIQLVGNQETPSVLVARKEDQNRLTEALEGLEPLDREIIAMRNFEHLDNRSTADLLGISPEAAYKRYVRALRKVRQQLGNASDLNG